MMSRCMPIFEQAENEDREAEPVGSFEMRLTVAQTSPEASERWDQRIDALAAWLMAERQRQERRESTS